MTTAIILRVGLTGNIGAGKSTVAGMLRQAGCFVVDLDELGHELLKSPGSTLAGQIAAHFGRQVLDARGAVDRRQLGALVFSDASARAWLERLVHPRIRALEESRVQEWPVARGIAITEAALLVETGGWKRYDRLIVVTTPRDLRLQRLSVRGMPRAEAESRMAAQMPQQDKVRVADYVIDNRDTIAATRSLVRQLLLRLRQDLDRLVSGLPLSAAHS